LSSPRTSSTGWPMRVIMRILTTTNGESVTYAQERDIQCGYCCSLISNDFLPFLTAHSIIINMSQHTCTPMRARGDPIGPILKGITYIVRPICHCREITRRIMSIKEYAQL
jgi:hypothetical protein